MRDTVGDCETYPNFFCAVFQHADCDHAGAYEISERRDDSVALVDFLMKLQRLVGFNVIRFDYPLLHYLCQSVRSGEAAALGAPALAARLCQLAGQIIASQDNSLTVWESDRIIPLLDLMLLHGLDVRARATSLKALQVAMRSPTVQDLPFPPGKPLTPEQMDVTIEYCAHDVLETERFYRRSAGEIAFREELGPKFWNKADTRIGREIVRQKLEARRPGSCRYGAGTPRTLVCVGDLIFPYVRFQSEPFRELLGAFREKVVPALQIKKHSDVKSVFYKGIRVDYGLGGFHGSVRRQSFRAGAEEELLDVDVGGFYPSMIVRNRLRPAHLGEEFCDVVAEIVEERAKYDKKHSRSRALKFAGNAVFGSSGDPHSFLYDVAFMLAVTVNGQLLASMLLEALLDCDPDVRCVQANTDGVTVMFPRRARPAVDAVVDWWQAGAGLVLETKSYAAMHVRDVNNYVAVGTDGKVKRKGAYEYELEWWKDPSALCVPRAAEAALVRGEGIEAFLERRLAEDPWDFLYRGKCDRSSRLEWGPWPAQRTTRFYVARPGAGRYPLVKVMPPLAGRQGERRIQQAGGRPVVVCDSFDGRPPADLDLAWYAAEARKLLI